MPTNLRKHFVTSSDLRLIYSRITIAPRGRVVKGVGLLPLACWDCGFESQRGHGCLSLVSVVCCQVEVSAPIRPLVRCGVSEYDQGTAERRPRPTRAVES
jgi:hypothetical protein